MLCSVKSTGKLYTHFLEIYQHENYKSEAKREGGKASNLSLFLARPERPFWISKSRLLHPMTSIHIGYTLHALDPDAVLALLRLLYRVTFALSNLMYKFFFFSSNYFIYFFFLLFFIYSTYDCFLIPIYRFQDLKTSIFGQITIVQSWKFQLKNSF